MTDKEFAAWVVMVKGLYPQMKELENMMAAEMWFKALNDLTIDQLNAATNVHLQNSPYPPKVYDLRQYAAKLTEGETSDWGEAWEEVQKAIKKFGSYREGDALKSMSPLTARAAKAMDFKAICMSENIETTRAQFRDVYNSFAKKETEHRQLSPDLRRMLENANVKLLQ